MTYLDLSLKEYLLWLHQKEVLTIYDGSTPKYLILCQPLQENKAVFTLPLDTPWEASLDNMGYAVVACHLAEADSSGQSYQKSRFQQLATGLGWHQPRHTLLHAAHPPSPVSRKEAGSASPTSFMAWMTSSQGIGLAMPAKAICAAERACETPPTLR